MTIFSKRKILRFKVHLRDVKPSIWRRRETGSVSGYRLDQSLGLDRIRADQVMAEQ
jgi:hypothetical protein